MATIDNLNAEALVALLVASARIRLVEFDAQLIVLLLESLGLLLHCGNLLVLLLKLSLELANLVCAVFAVQLLALLATSIWTALIHFHLLFEAEDIKDETVGAVEDQGQEEGEAGEVHVALRVELAGLDFHSLGADGSSLSGSSQLGFSVVNVYCLPHSAGIFG
jgi:hypothetical protein